MSDSGISPPSSPAQSPRSSVSVRSRSRSSSPSSERAPSPSRSRSRSRSRSSSRSSRSSITAVPGHDGHDNEHHEGHAVHHDTQHGSGHGTEHHSSGHTTGHHNSTTHNELHASTHTSTHTPTHEPKPLGTPPPRRHPLLARLALPAAILVGLGIAAGATYAVVAHVQNLLANASVRGTMSDWKARARSDVYDACYEGCTSCDDPNFAYNACAVTARAVAKGVVDCDAGRMWNWAVKDRYPDACLAAVAVILMGNELEGMKNSYRGQLGLIAVTVLGGLLGAVATYKLWRMATMSKPEIEYARAARGWSLFKPKTWGRASAASSEEKGEKSSRSSASLSSGSKRGKGKGKGKNKKVAAVVLGLFSSRGAAYACVGHDAAWSQFFSSPNGAITGVVHGWFSECKDRQDCVRKCRNSCTTSSSGTKTCSDKCTNDCHTVTYTTRTPKSYVDDVLPKVRACGFKTVDALGGSVVTTRVANANIERNLWVRVSVNGLNVTKSTETDASVRCLHDMAG
ncbi:hypothetical protein B0H67DRAFT_556492 [Lasiosphaeris hirsuta]|uniref:Uncharacterized protein n=1 Tax=Lasiosphaeris hirsuta TaxID=260670 RepID=A0AA40A224_9PEZI|nr:hypothetical protein B0H67DRAFT_556492 [Lasiosphaeris hirsuta]